MKGNNMLTIESLQKYGADTADGLNRCLNNEGFYLGLVKKFAFENNTEKLASAVSSGNLDEAFSLAHNLKGSSGNLGLTPLYGPISEMTDELRSRRDIDYSGYLAEIQKKLEELRKLCSD